MMMTRKIIYLLLIFSLSSDILANQDKATTLVNIIDEELREVTRLNKTNSGSNPVLLLRMAELLLEKARVLKNAENKRYIGLSPKVRRSRRKESFFKQSNSYFAQAQKTCLLILKKFKRFRKKADVYYILAFNFKEFGNRKRSEGYFKRAIKASRNGSEINKKSKLAMAELLYNKKEYGKAENYYEQSLDKASKWWTKDAFNLAWCYFRNKKPKSAINLMKQVHEKSKQDRYVDVSFQVERDLAYFYTESGRTKEAVNFYKSIGKNISKNLMKTGIYLKNQGRYKVAENTLVTALGFNKGPEEEAIIRIELLSVLERYGKVKEHLTQCQKLTSLKAKGVLNEEQQDVLKYHVKRMSATLQKQVVNKKVKLHSRDREARANFAVEYFKLAGSLEASKNFRNYFHAAETYYASKNFNDAVRFYVMSFEAARKRGSTKYLRMSLDGMMASLGQPGITKATTDQYLEQAYLNFIKYSKDKRKKKKVLERLFSIYTKKDDVKNAEKVLMVYRSNFPRDIIKQEAMLASVMEHHRKNNDKSAVIGWVKRINSGEFKVTKKYANKLRQLVLTLQFENVEKASSKGDKLNALKGYVFIYRDQNSTVEARKSAAYNIAILFYELGNAELMFRWAKHALSLMDTNDLKKFNPTFLSFANELFAATKTDMAAYINEVSFLKLCKQRKIRNKKLFFENATILYLSDGNDEKAASLIRKSIGCGIDRETIEGMQLSFIKAMSERKRWSKMYSETKRISIKSRNAAFMIPYIDQYRKALEDSGRPKDANGVVGKVMSIYNYAKSRSFDIPLAALDVVAGYRLSSLKSLSNKLRQINLTFPEKTFNVLLQRKFKSLERLTDTGVKILSIGSGDGIVASYRILHESYRHVVDSVREFSPPGKSEAYVNSFKKSMEGLVSGLEVQANKFYSQAVRAITKDNILSDENFYFLSKNPAVRFHLDKGGILMDKGGKR